jgi:hypothetical protein
MSYASGKAVGALANPCAAAALLLGELGVFSQASRGWRSVGEEIISADGWRHAQLSARSLVTLNRSGV